MPLPASSSGAMMFAYVAVAAIMLILVGMFVHWLDLRVQRLRGVSDRSSSMDSLEAGKANYDMRSATPMKPSRAVFGTSASASASPAPLFPDSAQAVRTPLDAASPGADTRTTEQSPYQILNSPGSPQMPPLAAGASMRSPHQPLVQHTGHRPSSRLSTSLSPLREAES